MHNYLLVAFAILMALLWGPPIMAEDEIKQTEFFKEEIKEEAVKVEETKAKEVKIEFSDTELEEAEKVVEMEAQEIAKMEAALASRRALFDQRKAHLQELREKWQALSVQEKKESVASFKNKIQNDKEAITKKVEKLEKYKEALPEKKLMAKQDLMQRLAKIRNKNQTKQNTKQIEMGLSRYSKNIQRLNQRQGSYAQFQAQIREKRLSKTASQE